jgi:hypothetical protein
VGTINVASIQDVFETANGGVPRTTLLPGSTPHAHRGAARAAWSALIAVGCLAGPAGLRADDDRHGADRPEEAVERYLLAKYPLENRKGRSPYFERGEAIREIPVRSFNNALPETRFLATTVWSRTEFPEIPVVVAVRPAPGGGWEGVAECLCRIWSRPTPKAYLDLFRGRPTASDAERDALGLDIARLFAASIPGGVVKHPSYKNLRYEFDIRGNHGYLNKLAITFAADGRLIDVQEVPPPQVKEEPGEPKRS